MCTFQNGVYRRLVHYYKQVISASIIEAVQMLVELFIHHLGSYSPSNDHRHSVQYYNDCSTSDCRNANLWSLFLTFIMNYYYFKIRKHYTKLPADWAHRIILQTPTLPDLFCWRIQDARKEHHASFLCKWAILHFLQFLYCTCSVRWHFTTLMLHFLCLEIAPLLNIFTRFFPACA